MAQFSYTGTKDGQEMQGSIAAKNLQDAGSKLRKLNILPTNVEEMEEGEEADKEPGTFLGLQISSDKLSDMDVMMFTKKLETMIKSDLPIMDALQLARRQAVKPGLIKVTKSLIIDLNQGNSFSDGLSKFSTVFRRLVCEYGKSR